VVPCGDDHERTDGFLTRLEDNKPERAWAFSGEGWEAGASELEESGAGALFSFGSESTTHA